MRATIVWPLNDGARMKAVELVKIPGMNSTMLLQELGNSDTGKSVYKRVRDALELQSIELNNARIR